jgi:ABC-type molybdate transport system substrate-binding protein
MIFSHRKNAMSEIKVLSSIATKEAYLELVPQFERASGHTVVTTWSGTTAIMKQLAAGEQYDLVMISATELDELIRQGKIVAGSRVDIAKSGIGIAVRKGNDLLRQSLNWALFRLWEKGRYTDLWLRYFSVSPF